MAEVVVMVVINLPFKAEDQKKEESVGKSLQYNTEFTLVCCHLGVPARSKMSVLLLLLEVNLFPVDVPICLKQI